MTGYGPTGEHLLFTLLMTLLLLGSFTIVALVMFWAPAAALFKRYDDPPEPRRPAE